MVVGGSKAGFGFRVAKDPRAATVESWLLVLESFIFSNNVADDQQPLCGAYVYVGLGRETEFGQPFALEAKLGYTFGATVEVHVAVGDFEAAFVAAQCAGGCCGKRFRFRFTGSHCFLKSARRCREPAKRV